MLEMLIYGLMDKFRFKSFLALSITNIILNITMNLILVSINEESTYYIVLYCSEIFVFAAESLIYYIFTKKRLWYCFLASFTANISSYAVGNAINHTQLFNKSDVVIITIIAIFCTIYCLLTIFSVLFSFAPGLFTKNDNRNKEKR